RDGKAGLPGLVQQAPDQALAQAVALMLGQQLYLHQSPFLLRAVMLEEARRNSIETDDVSRLEMRHDALVMPIVVEPFAGAFQMLVHRQLAQPHEKRQIGGRCRAGGKLLQHVHIVTKTLQPSLCVRSQSRSAASIRVCQPAPDARNFSSTSGDSRIVMRSLVVSALGRPAPTRTAGFI